MEIGQVISKIFNWIIIGMLLYNLLWKEGGNDKILDLGVKDQTQITEK